MQNNDESYQPPQESELQPSGETLYEHLIQESQDNFTWGRALETREAGDREIPACAADIFSKDIPSYRLQRAKISQFLQFHPEPIGGFLKTPYLESSVQVSPETRRYDMQAADNQRATLVAIRPLLTALELLQEKFNEEESRPIIQAILGSIRLTCHAAEAQNTMRKQYICQQLKLPHSNEELWKTSSPEPEHLFGTTLRKQIEDNKKLRETKKSTAPPAGQILQGGGYFVPNQFPTQSRPPRRNYYSNNAPQSNSGRYNQPAQRNPYPPAGPTRQ